MATNDELKQAIRHIESWIYCLEGIGIKCCYEYSDPFITEQEEKSFKIVMEILGENNGNN